MSLMRGKLFAGALLGGQGEQVPVTPEVPASGGFGYAQYQPAKVIKHVKAHAETWQKQTTIVYARIAYEQPVFIHRTVAFGKTEQRQDSFGSIKILAPTIPVQTPVIQPQIVSTHFAANAATSQVQATRGTVSVAICIPTDIPTNKEFSLVADHASISISANANTQQQGTNAVVSAHYQQIAVTASTEQQQATHGIVNARAADSQLAATVLSIKAASAQHQSTVGKVTTEDDEMLMILLALLELDNEIT